MYGGYIGTGKEHGDYDIILISISIIIEATEGNGNTIPIYSPCKIFPCSLLTPCMVQRLPHP